jgi:hypothetical protein
MIKLTLGLTVLFLIGAGLLFGITYTKAYTAGRDRGYSEGLVSNNSGVCGRISQQVQWATNVSRDMTTSKHYTSVTANAIKDAESAAIGYGCLQPVVPGNIYYPSATSSPVALSKPTLPLGHHPLLRKIP